MKLRYISKGWIAFCIFMILLSCAKGTESAIEPIRDDPAKLVDIENQETDPGPHENKNLPTLSGLSTNEDESISDIYEVPLPEHGAYFNFNEILFSGTDKFVVPLALRDANLNYAGYSLLVVEPGRKRMTEHPLFSTNDPDDFPYDTSVNPVIGLLDESHVLYMHPDKIDGKFKYSLNKVNMETGQTDVLIPHWRTDLDVIVVEHWNAKSKQLFLHSVTGYVWKMDLNEMKVEQLNQTFPGDGSFGSIPPSTMLYPSYNHEYFFYNHWAEQKYEFYSKDGTLLNTLPREFAGGAETTRIFWHPSHSIGLMKYIFEDSADQRIGGTPFIDTHAQGIRIFAGDGTTIADFNVGKTSLWRIHPVAWLNDEEVLLEFYQRIPTSNDYAFENSLPIYRSFNITTGLLKDIAVAPRIDLLQQPRLLANSFVTYRNNALFWDEELELLAVFPQVIKLGSDKEANSQHYFIRRLDFFPEAGPGNLLFQFNPDTSRMSEMLAIDSYFANVFADQWLVYLGNDDQRSLVFQNYKP